MHYASTTGLHLDDVAELAARIRRVLASRGVPLWIRRPGLFRMVDSAGLALSGWEEVLAAFPRRPFTWVADTAYIATNAITPIKKRAGHGHEEWEKDLNRTIAGPRAPIEHAIAHLKNWRTLPRGHRGPLDDIPDIIPLATKLELFRIGW